MKKRVTWKQGQVSSCSPSGAADPSPTLPQPSFLQTQWAESWLPCWAAAVLPSPGASSGALTLEQTLPAQDEGHSGALKGEIPMISYFLLPFSRSQEPVPRTHQI